MNKQILDLESFKFRRLLTRLYDPYKNNTMYGNNILSDETGGIEIGKLLESDAPCMIGRIGCSEVLAVYSGLEIKYGLRKHIDKTASELVCTNAGFFPKTDNAICKFGDVYTESASQCDYFAYLLHHHIDYFVHKYCDPNVTVGTLRSLEPYYCTKPWTAYLEGKKVLVVHPFEKSIRHQYENNRDKLFEKKEYLPEFELKTVKAVQTIGDNTAGFNDWFEALEFMKDQISKVDFDIAVIGCGAYGFPLAAYIKKELKKKSIVLGGATQILFGIKGSRWTNHPVISEFFNEYWITPTRDEVPQGYRHIENGCYW